MVEVVGPVRRNADPVPLPRIPDARRRARPVLPPRTDVGCRTRGGELRCGAKPGRVWVNAFIGQGITVDLTPDEAEAFALGLLEQARAARQG